MKDIIRLTSFDLDCINPKISQEYKTVIGLLEAYLHSMNLIGDINDFFQFNVNRIIGQNKGSTIVGHGYTGIPLSEIDRKFISHTLEELRGASNMQGILRENPRKAMVRLMRKVSSGVRSDLEKIIVLLPID